MKRLVGLVLFACAFAFDASAQDPSYFDPDNFGKAVKRAKESSFEGRQMERVIGDEHVFENVYDMRTDNRFRQLGRSVGMLDLLVRKDGRLFNSTCTATLIAQDRIITNYHCVPGLDHTVVEAQLRLGFLHEDYAEGTAYPVSLPVIENDRALDYAILRVSGVPADRYPPIKVKLENALDRESLFMIHHPASLPQRLTRFNCRAAEPAVKDGVFRHFCDTLGGSSGSLIFTDDEGGIAAIHHSGSRPGYQKINFGTPFNNLFGRSNTLRNLVSSTTTAPKPVAPAPAPFTPAPYDSGAALSASNKTGLVQTFKSWTPIKQYISDQAKANFSLQTMSYGGGDYLVSFGPNRGVVSWATRPVFDNFKAHIKDKWDESMDLVDVDYINGAWVGVFDEVGCPGRNSWVSRGSDDEMKTEIKKKWDEGAKLISLTYGDDRWMGVFCTSMTGQNGYTFAPTVAEIEKAIKEDGWDKGFDVIDITKGPTDWAIVRQKDACVQNAYSYKSSIADFRAAIRDRQKNGYRLLNAAYGDGIWFGLFCRD